MKEYRLKSIKGKYTKGEVPEKPGNSFQMSLPGDMLNFLNNTCDNTCEVLPTKEAYLSLDVQGFVRVQLSMHAVPLRLTSTTQTPGLPTQEQNRPFAINHIIRVNLSCQTGAAWPKASDIQKHSFQGGYSKGFIFQPLFLRGFWEISQHPHDKVVQVYFFYLHPSLNRYFNIFNKLMVSCHSRG